MVMSKRPQTARKPVGSGSADRPSAEYSPSLGQLTASPYVNAGPAAPGFEPVHRRASQSSAASDEFFDTSQDPASRNPPLAGTLSSSIKKHEYSRETRNGSPREQQTFSQMPLSKQQIQPRSTKDDVPSPHNLGVQGSNDPAVDFYSQYDYANARNYSNPVFSGAGRTDALPSSQKYASHAYPEQYGYVPHEAGYDQAYSDHNPNYAGGYAQVYGQSYSQSYPEGFSQAYMPQQAQDYGYEYPSGIPPLATGYTGGYHPSYSPQTSINDFEPPTYGGNADTPRSLSPQTKPPVPPHRYSEGQASSQASSTASLMTASGPQKVMVPTNSSGAAIPVGNAGVLSASAKSRASEGMPASGTMQPKTHMPGTTPMPIPPAPTAVAELPPGALYRPHPTTSARPERSASLKLSSLPSHGSNSDLSPRTSRNTNTPSSTTSSRPFSIPSVHGQQHQQPMTPETPLSTSATVPSVSPVPSSKNSYVSDRANFSRSDSRTSQASRGSSSAHSEMRSLQPSKASTSEDKSDSALGIGTGSVYVQRLRADAGEVYIAKLPASLPIGIRARAKSPSVHVAPDFLRKAMDIRYTHLPQRMLETEVDDDDAEGPVAATAPPGVVARPTSSASLSSSRRSSSPVESIVEQTGKIKLFVANPDDD